MSNDTHELDFQSRYGTSDLDEVETDHGNGEDVFEETLEQLARLLRVLQLAVIQQDLMPTTLDRLFEQEKHLA